MSHGKYEASQKRLPRSFWLLFTILLIVMMAGGGVTAYLSDAASPAISQLVSAAPPEITVTEDYCLKVENPNYSVFLRAKILVVWENTETGNYLAVTPEEGRDYNLSLASNTKWLHHSDGFYYYKEAIQTNTVTAPIISFQAITGKEGYKLSVQLIAQSIQAAGTTDDDLKTAVEDAWGIDASQFLS